LNLTDVGTVIAIRELSLSSGQSVTVLIGKPERFPDLPDFYCPYQILGLGLERVRRAAGVDAVQAMELAHKLIGADLYTSKEYRAGELHWLEPGDGDLGFPPADSIADLGPKYRDECDTLSPLGVPASELKPGNNYFIVTHRPDGLPWPNVESLVYLGENVTGEDPGKLVFQDTDSYLQLGPYPNNAAGEIYLVTTERETLPPNLFELPGVIDQLNRYAAKQARAAAKKG
jgi:hypothetical protein